MNMLTQHVARCAGNIRHDGRLTTGKRIQQAGFSCVGAAGNHHLHAFAQQAALFGFGTHGIKIADDRIQLPFDFAVRQKIDLLIGEINGRLNIDTQVRQGFYKMINANREGSLQRVDRRACRLF